MPRLILALSSLALILAVSAVSQAATKCDEASLMKLEKDVGAMKNANAKKMAGEQVSLARKMMGEKKSKECIMHMDNAMKEMK